MNIFSWFFFWLQKIIKNPVSTSYSLHTLWLSTEVFYNRLTRPIFRCGQGPAEGRDDVHIDFPALGEAGWYDVQSAHLSVWNVCRVGWVHLKCLCDRVRIAVAVQIGVSVLTVKWSGFLRGLAGPTDLSARCASLSACEELGKWCKYRWHSQGSALLLDMFMSFDPPRF